MRNEMFSPLWDLQDNYGNFTGYSVDSDGVIVDTSDCPFFFTEQKQNAPNKNLYKIYNDGGHYVATPYFHSYGKRKSQKSPFEQVFDKLYYEAYQRQRKWEMVNNHPKRAFNANAFVKKYLYPLRRRFPQLGIKEGYIRRLIKAKCDVFKPEKKLTKTNALDIAFDSLYLHATRKDLKGEDLFNSIKTGLNKLDFGENLDGYISDKIEKKKRNAYGRKKRFRRKGYLNQWTHFVTFTYDDEKQTEESFRKKLRKCLSNLHTRRGWRYMGVFEPAPETGRLHFHGIFYIPDGEMVGNIVEKQDYSTKQGKMQIRHENDFFLKSFGRNDFEGISMKELKHGQILEYILKYIEKTGERIVYSRGVPMQVCKELPETEIVGRLRDFIVKFVLFDDTIDFQKDVLHYTQYKQISITDILCNPPRVA